MKNQLIDLNNALFAQLERVSEEGIAPDTLATEIQRCNAVSTLAVQIISNARLALDAEKARASKLIERPLPMLEEKPLPALKAMPGPAR
jgi:hypothetical protein